MPSPMIFVGETAARPADDGNLEILERRDDIVAEAPGIGNLAVGTDPQAAIDSVAEMLRELGENTAVIDGARRVATDRRRDIGSGWGRAGAGLRHCRGGDRQQQCRGEPAQGTSHSSLLSQ